MKKLRNVLAGMLALLVLVGSLPMPSVNASDDLLADSTGTAEAEAVDVEATGTTDETVDVEATETEEDVGALIERVELQDQESYQGLDSNVTTEWQEELGQYADWEYYDYFVNGTIYFKEGSVVALEGGSFEFAGSVYHVSVSDSQSYENPWIPGNTYTVMVDVLGTTAQFQVAVKESPVESIVMDDQEILEYADGYWETEYNEETGEYDLEYFYYWYPVYGTIYFKDGTFSDIYEGEFNYNEALYSLSISDSQSYETPWTGGNTYEVTCEAAGVTTTFDVTVEASPIESLVLDDVVLVANIDGHQENAYNEETGYLGSYFHYDYDVSGVAVLKNGSTVEIENSSFWYKGTMYSLEIDDGQSYTNQWTAGNSYEVTCEMLGVTDTITVTIQEFPIKSFSISDMQIVEYTNGYWCDGYDEELGEWVEYFYYNVIPEYTIVMNDGTVIEGRGTGFEYDDKWYYIEITDPQSYQNQWKKGNTYVVTAEAEGVTCQFDVEIIETQIQSIEILNVEKVRENENCWIVSDGRAYYYMPQFSLRVHYKDGTSEVVYSDNEDALLSYYQGQDGYWTVEGPNSFTVTYAGFSIEVPVEVIPTSKYDYVVQDNKAYITDCDYTTETLEIPTELDGYPVVGIISLGAAERFVKELTIPDSVIHLSRDFCMSELTTITIGSGVTYLDADMFGGCYSLQNIYISDANPYYCDVDGVVYDKEMTTLVAYPPAKGNAYTVPATVTNIDILNAEIYSNVEVTFSEDSVAFKTVDGVTYSADMTQVVFCNDSKIGKYVMPDTVTEILPGAFRNCSSLTGVTVSKNVTSIAYEAFSNCSSLEEVQLPSGIKTIEEYAFYYCESLNNIELPSGLEKIDSHAFYWSSIDELVIPGTVKSIGESAFYENGTNVLTLGNGIESIGNMAFASALIETLTIPDSVTYLGAEAFEYCDDLTEVTVGSGVSAIRDYAFAGCSSLKTVELKNTAVSIGNGAFSSSPIQNINWENVADSIGLYAFSGSQMTEVTLGNSVTELVYGAFIYNENITKIDVSSSLVKMGDKAFDDSKWYKDQSNGAVYLEHILYDYKGGMPADTAITVKNGTTVIAEAAFANQYNMTKITLPQGLLTVGEMAFFNCSKLKEINIPASVSLIDRYAFAGCTELTAINVAADNPYYSSINGVLFNKNGTELIWCPKQSSGTYEIPEKVDYVHTGAFGCSNVSKVVIKNDDISLGYRSIGYNCYDPASSSLGMWEYYKHFYVEMECNEGSNAHTYAIENLFDVTFLKDDEPIENPFIDVPANEYYTDPVLWAVDQGITSGLKPNQFAPEESCTRGQVVTFLWRAHGCPEPTTTSHNFKDLKSNEYYYKAVLWAVENGITSGLTKTTFAPDATVTRGQFVTFLHRAEGKPAYTVGNPFTDLKNGEYYYDAVLWAVENKVTSGLKPTLFGPEEPCTRGQVVTFLYRAYNK